MRRSVSRFALTGDSPSAFAWQFAGSHGVRQWRTIADGEPGSRPHDDRIVARGTFNPGDGRGSQGMAGKSGQCPPRGDYARLLDQAGQKDQLIRVLEATITHNPDDPKLVAYLGKELILSGRSKAGVEQLNKAINAGEANWKNYSALGSAYDQMGQHTQAREAYSKALQLIPTKSPSTTISACPTSSRATCRWPRPRCGRRRNCPRANSTRRCARTWRWRWACRAALTRLATLPAATCRPTRSSRTSAS